jgi:hypothetical protein
MHGEARRDAKRAEAEIARGKYKGPLHGVPVSLKDLYYTRGVRTTAGSRVLANFVPKYDSTVTARLRRAGAIIIGKNNLHEFAPGGDQVFSLSATDPDGHPYTGTVTVRRAGTAAVVLVFSTPEAASGQTSAGAPPGAAAVEFPGMAAGPAMAAGTATGTAAGRVARSSARRSLRRRPSSSYSNSTSLFSSISWRIRLISSMFMGIGLG